MPVRIGARTVPVDVAFGGAFYAIVDAEAAGVPISPERLTDLRAIGMAIKHGVESQLTVVHPNEPGLTGIYGTIFTGPPTVAGADLRNVTIFAEAEVDRSPCGTGTCAVLAVLDAMGVVDDTRPFVHESLIGTTFTARVAGRTEVGTFPAIVPELSGEAWITGEHKFIVQKQDPLRGGFGSTVDVLESPDARRAEARRSTSASPASQSRSPSRSLARHRCSARWIRARSTMNRWATTTVTSPSFASPCHDSKPGWPAIGGVFL